MLNRSSWNIRRRLVLIITAITLLLVLGVASIALMRQRRQPAHAD